MQFSTILHKATLIKRYKRFLADVKLVDGAIVTAHCPNTGSMESCFFEGCTVWLSPSSNPERKLKWTWEFSEIQEGLVGINTAIPNAVVAEAIKNGEIPEFSGYQSLRREVKYGKNSRIDILLESKGKPPCYIEIKNTTLRRNDGILFPDAVTERGRKHLEELSQLAMAGQRAVMLFFVNRPDGSYFAPADDIDPQYGLALRSAEAAGVEIIARRAQATPKGIGIGPAIPIRL